MASKYIQKFPIPGSFPDILHDFVREVLRDQPENIYDYGAAYFAALDDVSLSVLYTRARFNLSSHRLWLASRGVSDSAASLHVAARFWIEF